MIAMALYRLKPGFNPETASCPDWNFDGEMDYLLDSVFEIKKERSCRGYLMTIGTTGRAWYLHPDWVVPVVPDLNLTALGDEI